MTCSCEGSCPCCFVGEVDNYKCDNCKREFCDKCHGIKSGNSHHNVLNCDCVAGVKTKVQVITKKVITTDDSGHFGFMSCGACGANAKEEDEECPSCQALFMGLDTSNPYPFGGSDF